MTRVVQFGKRQPTPRPPSPRPPGTPWRVRRHPSRPARPWKAHRRSPWGLLPAVLGGSLLVRLIALELGPPLAGCTVKGNISPNTSERIYHVPGQEHYWETRINWLGGERWFCSEDAAVEAG